MDSALVAVKFDIDMLHQLDEFIKNGVFPDLKTALEKCVSEYIEKHPDLMDLPSNWFYQIGFLTANN